MFDESSNNSRINFPHDQFDIPLLDRSFLRIPLECLSTSIRQFHKVLDADAVRLTAFISRQFAASNVSRKSQTKRASGDKSTTIPKVESTPSSVNENHIPIFPSPESSRSSGAVYFTLKEVSPTFIGLPAFAGSPYGRHHDSKVFRSSEGSRLDPLGATSVGSISYQRSLDSPPSQALGTSGVALPPIGDNNHIFETGSPFDSLMHTSFSDPRNVIESEHSSECSSAAQNAINLCDRIAALEELERKHNEAIQALTKAADFIQKMKNKVAKERKKDGYLLLLLLLCNYYQSV